jgi:hypothetical protein
MMFVKEDPAERARRTQLATQAFAKARAIMRLKFGDYDGGPEFAKIEQAVINGEMTHSEAVKMIMAEANQATAQKRTP